MRNTHDFHNFPLTHISCMIYARTKITHKITQARGGRRVFTRARTLAHSTHSNTHFIRVLHSERASIFLHPQHPHTSNNTHKRTKNNQPHTQHSVYIHTLLQQSARQNGGNYDDAAALGKITLSSPRPARRHERRRHDFSILQPPINKGFVAGW